MPGQRTTTFRLQKRNAITRSTNTRSAISERETGGRRFTAPRTGVTCGAPSAEDDTARFDGLCVRALPCYTGDATLQTHHKRCRGPEQWVAAGAPPPWWPRSPDRAAVGRREGAVHERRGSAPTRAVHCRVCTILIGEGYEETRPIPLPNSKGFVCWRCYESLRRQAERRATADKQSGGASR
jgi:hypothetical protein